VDVRGLTFNVCFSYARNCGRAAWTRFWAAVVVFASDLRKIDMLIANFPAMLR